MPRKEFQGRIATIYASSDQEYADWVKEAKDAGVSLSKWVSEMVNKAKNVPKRSARSDDTSDLQAEIIKLRQEIETKDLLLEKQKTKLLKFEQAAFLKPKLSSIVDFDRELIKLLKSGGVWTQDKLCNAIHINIDDPMAMSIVNRQLQELRRFGLLQETARGWKWER